MRPPSSRQFSRLSRAQQLRINAVCNEFEAAWHAGDPPDLEVFLQREQEAKVRSLLLHYLIELDIDCHVSRGSQPQQSRYLTPFPDLDADWLAQQLADALLPPSIEIDESGSDIGGMELLNRVRSSELVSEDQITMVLSGVDLNSASAEDVGRRFLTGDYLTAFQLDSIQRRPVDPLRTMVI